MSPIAVGPGGSLAGHGAPAELVAASLLTSVNGAELHLVARDGNRLRLATDEATARLLAETIWRALEHRA